MNVQGGSSVGTKAYSGEYGEVRSTCERQNEPTAFELGCGTADPLACRQPWFQTSFKAKVQNFAAMVLQTFVHSMPRTSLLQAKSSHAALVSTDTYSRHIQFFNYILNLDILDLIAPTDPYYGDNV
jgi:hypothetical protein